MTGMDLNKIKETYDNYSDLCSFLTSEIEFKNKQLMELDIEIAKRQELINQTKEKVSN